MSVDQRIYNDLLDLCEYFFVREEYGIYSVCVASESIGSLVLVDDDATRIKRSIGRWASEAGGRWLAAAVLSKMVRDVQYGWCANE